MFRKILDDGQAGDNVGLLLRGVDKKEIKRGQILAKPGSITPHTTFKAEVYILKKEAKVDVIPHSITSIVLNSISVPWRLPAKSTFLKELK